MRRRPERIYINGSTRLDRQQAITLIKDAIQESGGWLLDFTMFSNISICFNLEVGRRNLGRLFELLVGTGVRLSRESEEHYAAWRARVEDGVQAEEDDLAGTIQVTFIHDEPDLRREVPAIPG